MGSGMRSKRRRNKRRKKMRKSAKAKEEEEWKEEEDKEKKERKRRMRRRTKILSRPDLFFGCPLVIAGFCRCPNYFDQVEKLCCAATLFSPEFHYKAMPLQPTAKYFTML
ncbi:hypothetical protein PoB_006882000 [Plakobranchus ocellatus]|uniref:Uncharacterized protein n=1 Tax=Plakobranchus ocellatus TaxID=259542 RepID=A0AAV4DEC1_9GAST|nr:hypothetical protein PoB_006882000 [Plakobranchus ocellatus]